MTDSNIPGRHVRVRADLLDLEVQALADWENVVVDNPGEDQCPRLVQ